MTVLLTRPQGLNASLAQSLSALCVSSIETPLIEIHAVQDKQLQEKAWRAQRIIFISPRAVDYALNQCSFWPEDKSYYAIGQATQARLAHYGIQADAPDAPYTSESLLSCFDDDLHECEVLIVRGVGGREKLGQGLQDLGAAVTYAEVYQRCIPQFDRATLCTFWQEQQVSIVQVTSAMILEFFQQSFKNADWLWAQQLQFIVPSPRLLQRAKQMGFMHVHLASGADDVAMLKQIQRLSMTTE
tara:strand:- start:20778 stop:21506 length:729 start_codon:yes stop_codon:yes gene_type:complete